MVAREQTRHQPPLYYHCADLAPLSYCCIFLCLFEFLLYFDLLFEKCNEKKKKNVYVLFYLLVKCNEKEIKRECVSVLCCVLCMQFIYVIMVRKGI